MRRESSEKRHCWLFITSADTLNIFLKFYFRNTEISNTYVPITRLYQFISYSHIITIVLDFKKLSKIVQVLKICLLITLGFHQKVNLDFDLRSLRVSGRLNALLFTVTSFISQTRFSFSPGSLLNSLSLSSSSNKYAWLLKFLKGYLLL